MNDLPRLVVDREQAAYVQALLRFVPEERPKSTTVTLTERPMMPCPQCAWHRDHGEQIFGWRCPYCYVEGSGNTATVAIPVGTRVEVGWEQEISLRAGESESAPMDRRGRRTVMVPAVRWHHVATATVTLVAELSAFAAAGEPNDSGGYAVDLTDIEATP